MKPHFKIVTFLLGAFAMIVLGIGATSCADVDLTQVEPDSWQRSQFERQVRKSVFKAVQSPGVDNGSTLIVSISGDTLLAPADSAMRANPVRTVYVDIQSPAYPKGVMSSKALAIVSTFTTIGVVILLILIVLVGLFITSWRRQSGRNRVIGQAIDGNYQLPEAFYTGTSSPAPVNVTQVYTEGTPAGSKPSADPCDLSQASNAAPSPTQPSIMDNVRNALKAGASSSPQRQKQIQTGFILVGVGLMIFLGFASGRALPAGFIAGGTVFVIGVSKLLAVYMNK